MRRLKDHDIMVVCVAASVTVLALVAVWVLTERLPLLERCREVCEGHGYVITDDGCSCLGRR